MFLGVARLFVKSVIFLFINGEGEEVIIKQFRVLKTFLLESFCSKYVERNFFQTAHLNSKQDF